MSSKIYRSSTLGYTLQESVDEFIKYGLLESTMSAIIMLQFDKSIEKIMASQKLSVLRIRCDKLRSYRLCDKVWTLLFHNTIFEEYNREIIEIEKMKIIACEADKKVPLF